MVYLTGAGPGDTGLVTVKALELIKKADCIVYDRLAAPELLDDAREDCEKIYVGKADSRCILTQEQINGLLVEKARIYKCVVRLKGGDPYVFGRGGEEGMYLRAHDTEFTVVPGVSSAVAGAAYAGIPVIHRVLANSFRVITAHRMQEGEPDYRTMLDEDETLVFLMGLARIEQIAEGLVNAGRKPETPAAVISCATTNIQQVCEGTLSDIAEKTKTAALLSPAMVVVGNVVSLREQLSFFEERPLWGKRFLVPKIGTKPSRLAEMLRARGAFVKECAVGRITGIPAKYRRQELAQVDILLFTSANGVEYFMKNLFSSGLDVRALHGVKIAVIGNKTAEKLQQYGLRSDLIPEKQDSAGLVRALKEFIETKVKKNPFQSVSIWYPTAKNAEDDLVDAVLSVGECGRLNVYENAACVPEDMNLLDFDGIFFTCASSAKRLLAGKTKEELQTLNSRVTMYSIGSKCSGALKALGVDAVEAAVSSYEGLCDILTGQGKL